jgi:hypothetical protein
MVLFGQLIPVDITIGGLYMTAKSFLFQIIELPVKNLEQSNKVVYGVVRSGLLFSIQ